MKDELYNINLPDNQDMYVVLRFEGENAVYYDHRNDEEFSLPLTDDQKADIEYGESIEHRMYVLPKIGWKI
ncbi:hypothetical protein [Mammaliicoccus sciuri]|uniref:hypothetical protein n=1 Tax=Mammaliicoccus sciuri TaxID=1296 RepID=UPI002DBCF6C9|nr:hypothetical protein [Mammaliicoccus sciuri]MEB7784220.1 hypothetical protein [Mammaliicoccus sciuri]